VYQSQTISLDFFFPLHNFGLAIIDTMSVVNVVVHDTFL